MQINPVSYLPGTAQLPDRPRQLPLNWQQKAQEFDRFVMDPANGVIYRDERGHVAATDLLVDDPAPAYLYYNPWPKERTVQVPLHRASTRERKDVVDLGSGRVLVQAALVVGVRSTITPA